MDFKMRSTQERELLAAARPNDLNEESEPLLELELDASALRDGAFALLERMASDGLLGNPRLSGVVVRVQRAANELGQVEQLLDDAIVPGTRRSGVAPSFSEEAALAVGIAGTALSLARTGQHEADRWLRVLGLHGEAGLVLQSLGLPDAPVTDALTGSAESSPSRIGEPVRRVGLCAANIARVRHAGRSRRSISCSRLRPSTVRPSTTRCLTTEPRAVGCSSCSRPTTPKLTRPQVNVRRPKLCSQPRLGTS